MATRVAIYARVSTGEQNPEAQLPFTLPRHQQARHQTAQAVHV